MVTKKQIEKLSGIFKMLSDEGRLKIMLVLRNTEMCVAHICEAVGMEQSSVSHQLKNLKGARLIKSRKDGKNVFYSLDDEHVMHIIDQTIEHINHN
ncbi:MAG: metalloregulator ArsR/SmtB family transcription factor [Christensenellaceae bacterium]